VLRTVDIHRITVIIIIHVILNFVSSKETYVSPLTETLVASKHRGRKRVTHYNTLVSPLMGILNSQCKIYTRSTNQH